MAVSIHWFRRALRLHDNPALLYASKDPTTMMIPLFILDPWLLQPEKGGVNRVAHLLETLQTLDENLKKKRSRLFIVEGTPSEVLPAIIKQFDVQILTFESDTEPYTKKRDKEVIKLAEAMGVDKVKNFCSHTLYDPAHLLKLAGGRAPLTMPVFLNLLSKAGSPQLPLDSPTNLPRAPAIATLNTIKGIKVFDSVPTLSYFEKFGYDSSGKTTRNKHVGGEDEALRRMDKFLSQKRRVATYEKPKTLPTTMDPDSTALSPYLQVGSLGVRLFHARILEVYKSCGNEDTLPLSYYLRSTTLQGQLYWREMSYLIAYSTPNFDQMVGNPICKQIPWYTGPEADEMLTKWEFGQTGYPAVDAAMNQLRNEGWLHHLARHLVACFLTRGDLWLHWEKGRDVFNRYLLDADWSIINFNWQYMSCSALFHQYFRCSKPQTFFKKMDPKSDYIRRHVPILKNFPEKFICEPWLAPMAVQVRARCVIGKDYPKPIVDHEVASKENGAMIKLAYDKARQLIVREDGEHKSAKTQTLGEKRKSVSFAECELPAKKEKQDLHKISLELNKWNENEKCEMNVKVE